MNSSNKPLRFCSLYVTPSYKNLAYDYHPTYFSDIRFIVGEERQAIYAHKCLLAARCEVFKAMFAVKEGESSAPLVLSDIRPQIFLAVLEFVYTNCSSLSTDMVIDVLAASIEYGLDGLTKASINIGCYFHSYNYSSLVFTVVCSIHEGIHCYRHSL